MSAESELNDLLLAHAPLTAVVAERIYPDYIAQEIVPPAIVYQRTGTEPVNTIHNAVIWGNRVTLEVWCLDLTRRAANDLADLVQDAMAAASQTLPPTEVRVTERRPEYEPENERYVTVVVCDLWPQ